MATTPTRHSGHVLGALGIAQPDFEAAKTDVAARIHRLLEQRRVSPDAIATLLQVRESELSTLFQGRLATCSLECLLLRYEIGGLDLGIFRDVSRGKRDLLDRRLFGDECSNLDALLDLFQRLANVEHDEPEQPHREKGKRDRRYAQHGKQWSTPSGKKSVAERRHSDEEGLFDEPLDCSLRCLG